MELFHEVITCGCIMFFFNNDILSSPHCRIVKSVVLGRRRCCTTPEKASFNLSKWLRELDYSERLDMSVDIYFDHLYLTSFSPSCLYSNSLLTPPPLWRQIELGIRAQWDRCWGPKSSKIETGHLFSIVKLNFNVGLFSCIFWFEAIFLCKSAIFCRSLFTREKGPK